MTQQHVTLWVTGQQKSSKTIAPEVEEEVEDNVAAPYTVSSGSWGDSEGSPTMNLYNYYSLLGHAITWECVIAVTVQVYFKYDAI
jgi:hypothetical protein